VLLSFGSDSVLSFSGLARQEIGLLDSFCHK
jgi:hypothetical protein